MTQDLNWIKQYEATLKWIKEQKPHWQFGRIKEFLYSRNKKIDKRPIELIFKWDILKKLLDDSLT